MAAGIKRGDASVKAMSGWPNLADLSDRQGASAPVGLVGAPLEVGSVTPGRCDQAPALLRATLRRMGRYDVETRAELATLDRGPWRCPIAGVSIEEATGPIRRRGLRVERRATSADPADRRQ